MIERIIDAAARNRFTVFVLTLALAAVGWWSVQRMPLDIFPDLGETQVIVLTRWDRSPDVLEDQVTHPIVTALVGAPHVKAVRGLSDFGASFVYVVFEDGTDPYWARARVQEILSSVLPRLPSGARTEIGPDATALGWVFQYVLADRSGRLDLAELRSLQDWFVRYHLRSVPGVADVASVGGHVRQYQVNVDPVRLRGHGLSIERVVEAVRGGNVETGGRLLEFGGTEYMVRGRGYARSIADFENIVVGGGERGTPVRIRDIGEVSLGPELRRGVVDLNGLGDAVSGIVILRQGENALEVIDRVKARVRELQAGLPPGVVLVPVYDRAPLVQGAVDGLKSTLLEIMVTVALVVLLFLWHPASAIIPLLSMPLAVLASFAVLHRMGISLNVMTLGGIAIAAGAMVDAAIVVVEQAHKHLEAWQAGGRRGDPRAVILGAIREVGRPSFFALLVIAAAFLPVLALEGQEGRLFRPMAITVMISMLVAAVMAITVDPALRLSLTGFERLREGPAWLLRLLGAAWVARIAPEQEHPVTRVLMRLYAPALQAALRHKRWVACGALAAVLAVVPLAQRLGWEFMPPLDEGSLLYMPTTMPGISVAEAQKLLQVSNRIIRGFPEVEHVIGKAGRADTPTDPAPLSMLETVIVLKPTSQWRKRQTWYSSWAPAPLQELLRRIHPDHLPRAELIRQMNEALSMPGVSNAWTMPIRGRVDMLASGIRTPVGLKITGPDLAVVQSLGLKAETLLRQVPGTRSVLAERTGTGYYLDIEWNREALARHGLSLASAQAVVQHAIGGETVGTTVEGRARYPINVRFQRDFRADPAALERVLVTTAEGERPVPLGQLAQVKTVAGPAMIRNENGLLTGYVQVDLDGRDAGSYVAAARPLLAAQLALPPGYTVSWSGEYEAIDRVQQRLLLIVPLTLTLIVLLVHASTRSVARTALVMLAVPFSAVGAILLVWLLGYHLSIGLCIGLIALLGVDAATGRFMLLYLDLACERARREGRLETDAQWRQAVIEGALTRLRPKFMTSATLFLGLLPMMWADGPGADVMKRVAAPMIGGILTSFLLELLVYPAVYEAWRRRLH